MKLALHTRNLTYYASIMLDAFHAHAQNYASIIGTSLHVLTHIPGYQLPIKHTEPQIE